MVRWVQRTGQPLPEPRSLLAPPRLHRLALQQAHDPALPGLRDTLDALIAASWQAPQPTQPRLAQIQRSINWVVLDALMAAVDSGNLHPTVDAEVRTSLQALQQWLAVRSAGNPDAATAARRIARYLEDPASVKLRPLPVVPPGAPI